MAHEIDQTTGKAAVFVTGAPAWHRLGTVIAEATTSAEAIGLAGLDWAVEKWPVQALTSDGQAEFAIPVPGAFATVRADTKRALGVVGAGYRVFQNREAFDFMDALVGDKLAMYETAGSLREGRRVWMLARLPKEYRAGPEDLIKPYLLLTNTHDGSQALRMIPTTVRVVCQNTLNLALREAGDGGMTISHHPRLESRVKEARQKLGVLAARFDEFDAELHAMLAKDLSVPEADGYFRDLAGVGAPHLTDRQKRAREAAYGHMAENFDNARNTLPGVKHTAWGAYNAVSEWADHQKAYRGKTEADRLDNQLNGIWFGGSHQIKQAAYRGALDLAGAIAD
jgi:phage/plasmid-like protein (TIGR03299 family)